MKPIQSIVIGTAGHIDHGKTALVRALTGIDTDRLPEEKRRGITIDLGFASLEVDAADGTPLRISFVDVPGHALFIRNMLAGTGCVPAVMLVIAADEGVMPQTREHLAICALLGISDGFTVISKSDLVDETQLQQVRSEIAGFLKGTFLGKQDSVIVPASAHTGAGLPSVLAELSKLATRARAADRARPVRLPIDRTFVKKGFGTVVTGTLLCGEIRVGQTLALEPGRRSVRVRGLQTHGEAEEVAVAGSRVAVNLSGVDAAEISRGQTLVAPSEFTAADVIDAEVRLLGDAPALKRRARVHFHAFTSEVMASVSPYEAVKPGESRLMRLKLTSPIVLAPGDRFVLRQPLPAGTIGGGRVLDACPLPRQRRSETAAWLEQLSHASMEQQVLLRIRRRGVNGIPIDALAYEIGLTARALRDHIGPLARSGEVLIIANNLAISLDASLSAAEAVLSRVKAAGSDGLKRSELRSQTNLQLEVLNAVLDRLAADKKVQVHADVVAIASLSTATSGKDARGMHAVVTAYLAAGLAAPSVRELAQQLRLSESEIRHIVTLLLREKSLVRMGSDDAFVHAKAVEQLIARLSSMRGKTLDIAGFKMLTGLTRKHAIPLLEYLDRERITRKQGEQRLIL